MIPDKPDRISKECRFDAFKDGKVLYGKKKGRLPAMGWNSWNAFGSGNTEELTKIMADRFIELGLKDLGYEYIVLDDGCYKETRIGGKLSNEEVKFPSGFKALGDYIHSKGLKFGMYNDIGTNLCAGAEVGTCGFEDEDAKSYLEWGVDFLKVDNCYYLWDNATFSKPENARYTFAPNIRAVRVGDKNYALSDLCVTGDRGTIEDDCVTGIGTYDGTGPDASPIGIRSSEVVLEYDSDVAGEIGVSVEYATGCKEDQGEWLQIAVGDELFHDDLMENSPAEDRYIWSKEIPVRVKEGNNLIRLMNHRRQENTLNSYARLLKALTDLNPDHDIMYSACEWGKTQPQNWAYKVCDSWRILNDITFRVGSDGDPGHGDWTSDYTTSVMSQYNKAVIMDEFSGLDKGWNDPDMLMIGMEGLNPAQNRTHMAMWCMMNAPLMLGLDLRRVEKDDDLYRIIANSDLIAINQDSLGKQAKRVWTSLPHEYADREYIRDNNRVDILCKPLSDDRFALSFINCSDSDKDGEFRVCISELREYLGDRIFSAGSYIFKDVWSGEVRENASEIFTVNGLSAYDNATFIVTPKK
ncbi:MAG: glycoside hydrolase family 27 protein [Lachnospiraceae bacterium]|nr:glycoside hydrolase family 27 protein [Lachnospiraceae bacterium]